jgi:DNA-directed RNA polymerase subunit L
MIEITKSTAQELHFTLRDVSMQLVNSLRRTILSEVENVAFAAGDVRFTKNTCPLHDDIMSKRISMVPLKLALAEVTAYVPGSITASLSVKNTKMEPMDVTTADLHLKLHGLDYPHEAAVLPSCPITGDHILLTRLQPGQEISLTATSSKGTPMTHACYACVSVASYGLEVDDEAVAAKRAQMVENKDGLDESDLRTALNHFDCVGAQRMIKVQDDKFTPLGYKFVMESESGMMPLEIVGAALEVLQRKFDHPDIQITTLRDDPTHLQFTINGEGDTMASVLQSVTVDNADEFGIVSAGYHIPHPLERVAVFLVKFADAPEDPAAILRNMLDKCKTAVSAVTATTSAARPRMDPTNV